jgi:hypothetical protein
MYLEVADLNLVAVALDDPPGLLYLPLLHVPNLPISLQDPKQPFLLRIIK